jgi:cytochrome b6-f complex iron-sulfur subunit
MTEPMAAPAQRSARPRAEYTLVEQYPPPEGMTRRSFLLSWAGLAWGTFALAGGVGTVQILRYMMPNVLFEPPMKFKAGRIEEYPGWDVVFEKFKQSMAIWLVKVRRDFNDRPTMCALISVCTHLGCTPNWLAAEMKFKCPCHGSGFRPNGINFEGPAPRPLERARISIDPVDGQIVVDKSKKFQYEKGEWNDPESYLDLSAYV